MLLLRCRRPLTSTTTSPIPHRKQEAGNIPGILLISADDAVAPSFPAAESSMLHQTLLLALVAILPVSQKHRHTSGDSSKQYNPVTDGGL